MTTVALSLTTALVLAPAPSATAASDCPAPAGDQPMPAFGAVDDFVFFTAGSGQGVGMSQLAAVGGAQLGCTAEEMLEVFYPGASISTSAPLNEVRVGLGADRTTSTVTAAEGPVDWVTVCDPAASSCTAEAGQRQTQPQGSTWRVTVTESGRFAVTDEPRGTAVWTVGDPFTRLEVRHEGTVVGVAAYGEPGSDPLRVEVKSGYIEFDSRVVSEATLNTVQVVTSDGSVSGEERYLRGLGELSSSYPDEALEVQAIASRTYLRRAAASDAYQRFDVVGNEAGQVYDGWAAESEDDGSWSAAIVATRDRVLTYEGEFIDARFGRSHGGHSDRLPVVEANPDRAYLRPVDVSAWEREADGIDPGLHAFTSRQVAAALGLEDVERLTVVERGEGGRPTREDVDEVPGPDGVLVVGSGADGGRIEQWRSGADVATSLGLGTARFWVATRATDRESTSQALACPEGRVPEDGFKDVPGASTHEANIDCMTWWGIVKGRDAETYDLEANVTREQMATIVAQVLREAGLQLPEGRDRFTDDDSSVHEDNINALAEVGVVTGAGGGRYAPKEPVKRSQMATFLRNAYELATASLLPEGAGSFADDDGSVHEANINAAAVARFVSGFGGTEYRPGRTVTREHIATFAANMLDVLVERGYASPPA